MGGVCLGLFCVEGEGWLRGRGEGRERKREKRSFQK